MNALELAKEFEEYLKSIEELPWGNYEVLCDLAVTKLRQQQESIEGLTRDYDLLFAEHQLLLKKEWVGLTDEERQDIALEVPIDAVLITEAKLKDKNR
jgi:hypothetical protein